MEPMRLAGLRGDRSQVPEMIAALKETPPPNVLLVKTILHSLAQMGATEALPAFAVAARDPKNAPFVSDYAAAARARLLAQSSAEGAKDGRTRAAALVGRFYQVLGETPEQMNEVIRRRTQDLKAHPIGFDAPPRPCVELCAMREVADMVYHGAYQDFADLPGVTLLDFSLDYPSAIKVRVAALPPGKQIAWLIEDLANKKVLTPNEQCEMYLAAELGPAASQAAAAKLQEMERKEEMPLAAFDALLQVSNSTRSASQSSLREHFKRHPDGRFAQTARESGQVQHIPGY